MGLPSSVRKIEAAEVRAKRTNAEVAALLVAKIASQIERGAGKGVHAAVIFLAARTRETLSVPAPRKAIRAAMVGRKKGAILGYRAATRATPGAPPRKLSGRLRGSVSSRMINKYRGEVGVSVKYGRFLEKKDHKFLQPTYEKHKADIRRIVGGKVRAEFK